MTGGRTLEVFAHLEDARDAREANEAEDGENVEIGAAVHADQIEDELNVERDDRDLGEETKPMMR